MFLFYLPLLFPYPLQHLQVYRGPKYFVICFLVQILHSSFPVARSSRLKAVWETIKMQTALLFCQKDGFQGHTKGMFLFKSAFYLTCKKCQNMNVNWGFFLPLKMTFSHSSYILCTKKTLDISTVYVYCLNNHFNISICRVLYCWTHPFNGAHKYKTLLYKTIQIQFGQFSIVI